MTIPIIDLFAGPGGLGEGFASVRGAGGGRFFEIALSIEKNPVAHKTLTLRAVFRRLRGTSGVKHYYRYIRGEITESQFREVPIVASAYEHAEKEAKCLELGQADEEAIDADIREALNGRDTWVLIGGPPCQAYSLAGRARRANDKTFQEDEKHFLYKEYLRIIRVHRPTIFVMENVKGLLSSRHDGDPMFERILKDLAAPSEGLRYEIRSFTKRGDQSILKPADYVIESERYGIPQSRHRVILLGVREDAMLPPHQVLARCPKPVTVKHAIDDMPKIRSRLSRGDSLEVWRNVLKGAFIHLRDWGNPWEDGVKEAMRGFADATKATSPGALFIQKEPRRIKKPTELQRWLHDRSIGGVCQHEARAHMPADLARYLFSASYAWTLGPSPRLRDYPPRLLPNHFNVRVESQGKTIPFNDRFRVQCKNEPATTVVAHIAKDGHYYIHYDPAQCRSLTVREAARLQTFPDNYFFSGTRTEQYTQVGNAVPPLLAYKLAKIVRNLVNEASREHPGNVKEHNEGKCIQRAGRSSILEQVHLPLHAETD